MCEREQGKLKRTMEGAPQKRAGKHTNNLKEKRYSSKKNIQGRKKISWGRAPSEENPLAEGEDSGRTNENRERKRPN